jgi:hypothetical protein
MTVILFLAAAIINFSNIYTDVTMYKYNEHNELISENSFSQYTSIYIGGDYLVIGEQKFLMGEVTNETENGDHWRTIINLSNKYTGSGNDQVYFYIYESSCTLSVYTDRHNYEVVYDNIAL